jgi:tetratricopeptide (TPR) repeat protein
MAIPIPERDPPIEILTATTLFYTGRLGDAGASFRDLARKMPGSSYIHSYLAKVLERQGDESAIEEYAAAVRLDPDNQDALRSYADYLLALDDCRAAIPVLRRLVSLGHRHDDRKFLARTLVAAGEAQEALALIRICTGDHTLDGELIDALILVQRYPEAALAAKASWAETRDPSMLRRYLSALGRYDPVAALSEYAAFCSDNVDARLLYDYALLLQACGKLEDAVRIAEHLVLHSPVPLHRLAECSILAESGATDRSIEAYEQLICDELSNLEDINLLGKVLDGYREILISSAPGKEAFRRFRENVTGTVTTAGFLSAARFCKEIGDTCGARDWYYRAYRSDFMAGGVEYARFLSDNGDMRESEKVMLHILANAKKNADLVRVAEVTIDPMTGLSGLGRLMDQLVKRLEEKEASLPTEGLEKLAALYLISAKTSIDKGDLATGKLRCLRGLDVLPPLSRAIRHEEFLDLIRSCKAHAIADRPVMQKEVARIQSGTQGKQNPEQSYAMLSLTSQEEMIVGFLRQHRTATEMDLRKLLGTRRVAGVMNRLIQKASSRGVLLIGKKGSGEDGEIYEFTGT